MTPPGKANERPPIDDDLSELIAAGKQYATLERRLEKARERRDRAIRHVSSYGISRRTVAEMANVTVGRVQQILDEDT